MNASGYICVADSNNNRIQYSTPQVNTYSVDGNGQFNYPVGIAVNTSGYAYVVDSGNNRIQVFTPLVISTPTVVSISPATGTTAGGTSVNVIGSGFTGASAVTFGSTPATSYTVTNDNWIMATAPAGTGTVDVTVTTSVGISAIVSSDKYTYEATSGGSGGYSRGGGGAGSGSGPAPAPAAQPAAAPQPAAPPAPPPAAPPNPATNPGIAPPAATASYPAGFTGLSYNANGHGTLSIDMAAARAAGATITTYFNHVDVYQHHSPGVLLTFWGNNFEINNGTITGPVSRAEFVTDPLNATLAFGNVSGSVHAELPALTQRVYLNLTVPGNVSTETLNQFQDILGGNGLQLNTVAYTFSVQKVNLTTGPANVTFTIPTSWVNQNGGKDAVRITRISDETGKQELLDTVYEGLDAQGNMIFRGDSPNGLSLFGLVTAEAYAAEQKANPNETYAGVSKSAMVTNVGMYGWVIEIILHNPVVLIGVIALLAVIAYFGWWKRRL